MTVRALCVFAVSLTLALTPAGCATRTGESADPPAAPCPPATQRYCAAAVGDLLEVPLSDLHPTQSSLGYDEVYYRLGRYTLGEGAAEELLDQWCATNGQGGLASSAPGSVIADPTSFSCEVAVGAETGESTVAMKTVVVGPGGQLYLTDGHHTLTSFWEAPGGGPTTRIRLKVTGNLASLQPPAFWTQMQDRGWTWLSDSDGKPLAPETLPANLGLKQFADDRYRGVLYFVRDVGYAQDDNSPAFQEFYWGQWLRAQTDPTVALAAFDLSDMTSYLTLVGHVGRAIVALAPDAVVTGNRTAQDLGRLDAFGQKAFDALSAPLDSPKPGKLTYSLAYKARR